MAMNSHQWLMTTQFYRVLPFISWRNNRQEYHYMGCNVFNSDYEYIVVSSSIGFETSRVDIAGAITSDSSIYSL